MVLDIVIVIILLISILIGYLRGFFKLLYDFIIVVLAAFFAYFFRNIFIYMLFDSIVIKDIPEYLLNIIRNILAPFLIVFMLYCIIYFILKIIVFILIKTNVLPDEKKPRWLGSVISFFITFVMLSFLILPISFTSLFEGEYEKLDLYSHSKLANLLVVVNPVTDSLSENVNELYNSGIEFVNKFSEIESLDDLTTEDITMLKSFVNENPITEEIIVEVSKNVLNDDFFKDIDYNFENVPFDEVKEEFKNCENYPMMKKFYDEGIITDEIIERIIDENNINGLDAEDIIKLFE